jgi:hypothetical protein
MTLVPLPSFEQCSPLNASEDLSSRRPTAAYIRLFKKVDDSSSPVITIAFNNTTFPKS